ncbi:Dual specificity protein kinase CLK3 [Camelus dromedarius]|uniref:Dual specificity protein kinase CLK3 n=2 Tax=Camelus dromedarius TaxID=9838 RepID=A0A5N4CEH7_CAMDR|nr:Dual specificity protein kinase CLK3 [Camelus dromedarius]
MHHCKRYRSPEPDPYLSYRWKRRRSYSREHEGRLRYPSRREPPPRRSRSRSHDRLPYQRRYREPRDSDAYRYEERSPSFGEDCYGSSRSHHRRRSREREPYRTRKHAHHCHKRRTRSCSSASSAIVVVGLEVNRHRGSGAPSLLEAGGTRAADERPFLVVMFILATGAV